jgi:hypothetical protein
MGKILDFSEGVKYFDFFIFWLKMFRNRIPLVDILTIGIIKKLIRCKPDRNRSTRLHTSHWPISFRLYK